MTGSDLHALLIGIDRYSDDGRPTLGLYPSLQGAVADVELLEEQLRRRGLSLQRTERLTASLGGGEDGETLPTSSNLIAALRRIRCRARPKDRLLIAFSGHGGRLPTLCPEVKGRNGIDESLILFHRKNERLDCLRDVELALILRQLIDNGLQVTLVLDCCHAGGTTRGLEVRGTGTVPSRGTQAASQLASRDEISENWRWLLANRIRRLTVASGWLPDPRGYVLFAACHAHERAYEGVFDGRGAGGALTRALVASVHEHSGEVSCREIHAEVLRRVRRWTEGQTPQLEGETESPFLGRIVPEDDAEEEEGEIVLDRLRTQSLHHPHLNPRPDLTLYRLPIGINAATLRRSDLRQLIASRPALAGSLRAGEWFCLEVANPTLQALSVAIFNVPSEGVPQRIYPSRRVGESQILLAGTRELLPLRASLPVHLDVGVDLLEVVAAIQPVFFLREAARASERFAEIQQIEIEIQRA